MSRTPSRSRSTFDRLLTISLPRRGRSLTGRQLLLTLFLSLLVLTQVLSDWSFLAPPAFAADLGTRPGASSNMTFQQFAKQSRQDRAYHGPLRGQSAGSSQLKASHPANYATLPASAEPATMKPISMALSSAFLAGSSGTSSLDLLGSDHRLEVQVAPGSLDLSQASIAGGGKPVGNVSLRLSQIHGHYVGEMNMLGLYQLQVLDSQGHVLSGLRLRHPVTIIYHYQQSELDALNLDAGHLVLTWPALLAAALAAKQPTTGLTIPMKHDSKAHTLTAQTFVLDAHPFTSGTGEPQNQSPPILHLASVQGNSGQLTYSYPLQVPPGPGGFAPQLALDYSSSGPNQRYSRTSPASDVGDGWTLNLGSITEETYAPNGSVWYFLNNVAGTGDRLIPIGSTHLFDTEHISGLRIQQINPGTASTCFHVWDKAGTYYELGCTPDSLQYWIDSGGAQHDYRWDLDKIIAPNEGANASSYRLMLVSYVQDSHTDPGTGHTAIRDAAIKQIIYGTGSANAVTTVNGTIDFLYHGPSAISSTSGDSSRAVQWVTAYGTNANYNCASTPPVNTSMRCDDPVTYGASMYPPTVMSTMTLDTVTSYVGSDAPSSSQDESYAFSYSAGSFKDTPFSLCYDSYSLAQEYCAGEHLLMSVSPTIYQQNVGSVLKGVTFGYSSPLQNSYIDSGNTVQNGSQQYGGQTFWQYLNFYEDLDSGVGGKVSWSIAYNNSHGTPTIKDGNGNVLDDRYDALYCTNHWADCSTNYSGAYANPNDRAWTEQVVTQITSLGKDSSSGAAATTTFSYYRLANTGAWDGKTTWCNPDQYSQEKDCVGDNWVPSGDSTWRDYYHAEYQGFAQVWSTSPANDLSIDYYYSTEGWYTAKSDYQNFEGGFLYREERYSGNSYNANAMLTRLDNTYANYSNACRSTSVTYPACEIVLLSTKLTDYEGTNSSSAPYVQHDYIYDDYLVQYGVGAGYHDVLSETTWGSNITAVTRKWNYTTNDQTIGNWTYYTVDKPTNTQLVDSAGHIWQCQDITYDEGAPSGTPTPAAGWPTTIKTYSNSACVTPRGSPLTTTYIGYDTAGNPVASVDGVATANSAWYTNPNGCTLTTAPAIFSSAWGKTRYTTCTTYDSYNAQPTQTTNAFGQSSSISYDYTQGGLPTSVTDPNTQHTTSAYSYPGSNRMVQVTLPLHTGSYTTQSSTNSSCTTTSTLPCYEVDSSVYQYSSVKSATFYDALGRAVETRAPGPGSGYDTIVITTYNDQNHTVWQSVPFEVTHGSGWIDPNGATDDQGVAPGGTVTYYDALGRPIAVQDPTIGQAGSGDGISCSATLSGTYTACTNYSIGAVSGDPLTYSSVTSIDPNKHVSISYADALGRAVYALFESGLYGGTLSAGAQKSIQYNALDQPTSVVMTDKAPQTGQSVTSASATASYDDLGRLSTLADPDRGSQSYSYDADGHLLSDISGTRTIGYSYDLLGRLGCVQDTTVTANATGACAGSGYHAYVQNTYDSTVLGTQGSTDFPIGQLTKSIATTYFPDGSSATVTDLYQHDQRGRLVSEQMQFGLPSGWGVTSALPTYQMALSYNDANQLTTTTTSTNPTGQGFTTTQVYDTTMGALVGLSNNGTASATLATLIYNARAQLDTINFQTTTGSGLASEQFGYDANLRPTSVSAVWLSGSGTSGTIVSQNRSYDAASNLISLSTTQATIIGQSGSGGSETANFCYDEQNRLVWAGNSGTQPAAGNGTCGSGTLSNSLNGAAYSNGFVYTHLGQLWKAPVNGSGPKELYLYCTASSPHQLTGIYPTGTTCSNPSGAYYTSSYDAWGNVTSRSYSGTTATLSYDLLDHFTQWYVSNTNQEQSVYDASGERVLRRSTNSTSTTMTVYAFGLEDHQYSGSGTNQWNTYYYTLAGQLIGALDSNGTVFYFTDGLGSVLSSFSNVAGGAAVKGNQVFGPYGKSRYAKGTINTAKGFTGQYNDSLTGLDYYGARYYDPVAGVFLSADTVQGNGSGENPYAYVGGNPETLNDPTGLKPAGPGDPPPGPPPPPIIFACAVDIVACVAAGVFVGTAWLIWFGPEPQPRTPDANTPQPQVAPTPTGTTSSGGIVVSVAPQPQPGGFVVSVAPQPQTQPGSGGSGGIPPRPPATGGDMCSFTSETTVTTAHGKKAIGTLRVGDKVLAYNPKTHKMELQPILHVWTHRDQDLVDVTLTATPSAHEGKATTSTQEKLHTTSEHPFLTAEQGFVAAGQLQVGMHVLRADGTYGVVTGWSVVPGTKVMYNLEVAQDHTFTVGDGQFVVHNECDSQELRKNMINRWPGVKVFDDGQDAHHIIPCQTMTHPVVQKAIEGGFDINEYYNGRALYRGDYAFRVLQDREPGPVHATHSNYNSMVEGKLWDIYSTLEYNSGGMSWADVAPKDAFDSLMNLIDDLLISTEASKVC